MPIRNQTGKRPRLPEPAAQPNAYGPSGTACHARASSILSFSPIHASTIRAPCWSAADCEEQALQPLDEQGDASRQGAHHGTRCSRHALVELGLCARVSPGRARVTPDAPLGCGRTLHVLTLSRAGQPFSLHEQATLYAVSHRDAPCLRLETAERAETREGRARVLSDVLLVADSVPMDWN